MRKSTQLRDFNVSVTYFSAFSVSYLVKALNCMANLSDRALVQADFVINFSIGIGNADLL